MNDEILLSLLEIFKWCAPYAIAWALGKKAFVCVVNAITGKDMEI